MMKRKERINRARLHKLARLGIGLAAFTALGSVQYPIGLETGGSTKVYAEESKSITYRVHYFLNDTKENGGLPSYTDIAPYKEGVITQGATITEIAPQIDGYVLTKETWNSDKDIITYDKMTAIETWSDTESVKSILFFYDKAESSAVDKPVETPAEKQVISSEVRILNVDGATYWKGEGLDKAVVGTTTVELEVGGDLTIPATVVPEGYEITDIRFNALSAVGVKELPHTWTYEEYKNYTSAPMSVPEIDILVKPVSSPATPVTPPAETPVVTAKVTAFKLEELVGANYKYQPMGTFSLEPVVIQLQPGETYIPPSYDGYKLVKFENSNSVTDIIPEEATISYADFTPGQEISLDYYYLNTKQVYDVVNKRYVDRDTNLSPLPPTETPTVDTPVTPPAETPTVDTPVTPPTETPTVDTPITPPTETPTVDTPVTPATETPTVDTPVTPATETPTVDIPATLATETPSVESPVTPPADSKPTETSPVINQSTQNQPAQTGDLGSQTDKKPVGQPAQESQLAQPQAKQASVKPQQETTQGAKSLPATGEAGSILGLAGLGFTGLSGLHYALRPRKRQRSARK